MIVSGKAAEFYRSIKKYKVISESDTCWFCSLRKRSIHFRPISKIFWGNTVVNTARQFGNHFLQNGIFRSKFFPFYFFFIILECLLRRSEISSRDILFPFVLRDNGFFWYCRGRWISGEVKCLHRLIVLQIRHPQNYRFLHIIYHSSLNFSLFD